MRGDMNTFPSRTNVEGVLSMKTVRGDEGEEESDASQNAN